MSLNSPELQVSYSELRENPAAIIRSLLDRYGEKVSLNILERPLNNFLLGVGYRRAVFDLDELYILVIETDRTQQDPYSADRIIVRRMKRKANTKLPPMGGEIFIYFEDESITMLRARYLGGDSEVVSHDDETVSQLASWFLIAQD